MLTKYPPNTSWLIRLGFVFLGGAVAIVIMVVFFDIGSWGAGLTQAILGVICLVVGFWKSRRENGQEGSSGM